VSVPRRRPDARAVVPVVFDRVSYIARGRTVGVSDTDLLGIVLGGIALLMFLTGIVLVV
jgi:hypothetical protein